MIKFFVEMQKHPRTINQEILMWRWLACFLNTVSVLQNCLSLGFRDICNEWRERVGRFGRFVEDWVVLPFSGRAIPGPLVCKISSSPVSSRSAGPPVVSSNRRTGPGTPVEGPSRWPVPTAPVLCPWFAWLVMIVWIMIDDYIRAHDIAQDVKRSQQDDEAESMIWCEDVEKKVWHVMADHVSMFF